MLPKESMAWSVGNAGSCGKTACIGTQWGTVCDYGWALYCRPSAMAKVGLRSGDNLLELLLKLKKLVVEISKLVVIRGVELTHLDLLKHMFTTCLNRGDRVHSSEFMEHAIYLCLIGIGLIGGHGMVRSHACVDLLASCYIQVSLSDVLLHV